MSDDVKIILNALRALIGTHGDDCKDWANCQAVKDGNAALSALDRIEGQAAKMESSLRNVSMLARRQVRKSREDAWLHILRFCEEAGIVANILRTDGTNNAPPTPAGGGALPTPDMLAAKMLPVPVSKGSGVVNQAVPSDTTKCAVCGGPKYLHRAEISAHHSECTLEQFQPVQTKGPCEVCKELRAKVERLKAETDYIGAKATAEWTQSVIDELRAELAAKDAEIGTIQAMLRVKDQHAAFAGQELATAQERIKALEDGLRPFAKTWEARPKLNPAGQFTVTCEVNEHGIWADAAALLAPAKEGEK